MIVVIKSGEEKTNSVFIQIVLQWHNIYIPDFEY